MMAMRWIHANGSREDVRELRDILAADMQVKIAAGAEMVDNSWSVTLPESVWNAAPVEIGHYIYSPGCEWGGPVTLVTHSTGDKTVTLQGPTWRGLLFRKLIYPAAGEDYYEITDADANAALANITVADGHIVNYTGGNLWMTAGLVTNCVIQNATLSWTTADANSEHGGAGVYMRGGTLVNCVVRGNRVTGTAVRNQATGVFAKGSAVILNCLFDANDTELESAVAHLEENAHMVGCTIVRSTLGSGTALNDGSASIRLLSTTAYVQNSAVAGVVDTDGTTLTPLPASRFENIANSAFDFDFDAALTTSKAWVRGTTATMFDNYASGKFRPAAGSPLIDAGKSEVVNPLPSVDIAGDPRLFRNGYDIGCYEWQGTEATVIVFR